MTGNIQYLRTDRAIQSALLTLLGKKPFEKITVQDILDETPVSRATFYKHFHDKYEIVEKIQEEVLQTHRELRNALMKASPDQYPALVERFSLRYKEISQLLMKVQTERVNLPLALVKESEAFYISHSTSPTRELEAKVYGATSTAIMVALLDDKHEFPLERTYDVVVEVALRILGMSDDAEIRKQIYQRCSQRRT